MLTPVRACTALAKKAFRDRLERLVLLKPELYGKGSPSKNQKIKKSRNQEIRKIGIYSSIIWRAVSSLYSFLDLLTFMSLNKSSISSPLLSISGKYLQFQDQNQD